MSSLRKTKHHHQRGGVPFLVCEENEANVYFSSLRSESSMTEALKHSNLLSDIF